ncbi:MAG: sigma-70 family RNA polymerase sigma factor [Candidatus Hydrogenedens sp.]|nr:sigma-70 family RNA polymerase sigma factor [Candidatus Hydrogenedens sp.]
MDDFIEQLEKHKDEFYRYIYRTAWNAQKADDIFQSSVLAAWENRHKFTPGTNFRAWMYRIITNKCYVANRVTSRTPKPLEDVRETDFAELNEAPEYGDVLNDPDRFLEACGDEVFQAMTELSEAQRMCLLLRSAEKFSYKEIADIMNIPLGTVMTHLSRGRAKLRRELMAYAQSQGIVRPSAPRNITRLEDVRQAEQGGLHG